MHGAHAIRLLRGIQAKDDLGDFTPIGPFFGSAVIFTSGYLAAMSWNTVFLIYGVGFLAFFAMLAFIYEPENDDTARTMLGIGAEASTPFPWAGVLTFGLVTLFGIDSPGLTSSLAIGDHVAAMLA